MATNLPTENVVYDTMPHFDSVAAQIELTFDQLIVQLIGRKGDLLRKVLQLREDFYDNESARKKAIQELEITQQNIEELRESFQSNLNIPIHQQASQVYEQGMQGLATPTKPLNLSFHCPTHDRLVSMIKEFGEVSEGVNYFVRKEPILTTGKQGKYFGEFYGARGLALDEVDQVIYIADMGNSRVQMFSFQAGFIRKFGENVLKEPWGITLSQDHILVTDISLHSLLRFNKKTLQLTDRVGGKGSEEGELKRPKGVAVDANGDVYIVDKGNNRVSIFSKHLQFLSCIGQGKLYYPQDVKLTAESVVVLDWSEKCVHFFSKDGDLLSSCVTQGSYQECLVYCPFFFCLDKDVNFIISDYDHSQIKIVSRSGELIHSIGSIIKSPQGVAISKTETIHLVSDYVLQTF